MAESKAELTDRWRREGREGQVAKFRQQVRDECRARGVGREEAHEAAWSEAARNFPPLPPPPPTTAPASEAAPFSSSQADSGRVQGLADIPTGWPEMPANASLAAEIGWVQANRLLIVEERPSGATVVRLERARSPAPSWAALGWLETSIRSYAKYVEVAAKATSTAQDEQELVRRERMRIDEIRGLLTEMNDQWAKELHANTPETIRVKVCSLLDDWAGRSGLTVPDKAKFDLGAHIGELVDDCLKILDTASCNE